MDALPQSLVATFGSDEQFFLTVRLLDINTPSGTSITPDAFKTLIAVKRGDKGFVPLLADEADKLLDSSIKADLIRPIKDGDIRTRYAPNPSLKDAISRFDKTEPKTD